MYHRTELVNAVLDGSDCVMLSGYNNTPMSAYPVKAVAKFARSCIEGKKTLETRENQAKHLKIMNNYAKISQLMAIVEQDSKQGVVGYAENGEKYIDIDLLDKEKEARKSEDQRQLESE